MSHLSSSRVLLILPKDRGLVHLKQRSAGNTQVKPSHSLTAKPEVCLLPLFLGLSNRLAAKSLSRTFYPAFLFPALAAQRSPQPLASDVAVDNVPSLCTPDSFA